MPESTGYKPQQRQCQTVSYISVTFGTNVGTWVFFNGQGQLSLELCPTVVGTLEESKTTPSSEGDSVEVSFGILTSSV